MSRPSGGAARAGSGLVDYLREAWETGRAGEPPVDGEEGRKAMALALEMTRTAAFAAATASGDLDRDLDAKGVVAGGAKSLQASLRHLAWQAGEMARGDLERKIVGMGSLSDAFNLMAANLKRTQAALADLNRELEARVEAQLYHIERSHLATIFALAKLAEFRDRDTGQHLERVRTFCVMLAETLGGDQRFRDAVDENFLRVLADASPLHDIGKVAIPDSILLKPGPLDAAEWAVMKTHPDIGASTLSAIDRQYPGNPVVAMGIDVARCHHERWDGSGYPAGLSGIGIPLAGRIVAVADVYDAIRSRRCYKAPASHEETEAAIAGAAGTHFDPAVADAFARRAADFAVVWDRMGD